MGEKNGGVGIDDIVLVPDRIQLDPRNQIFLEILDVTSSGFTSTTITDPPNLRLQKQLCKIQIGEGNWYELITTDAFHNYKIDGPNSVALMGRYAAYDLKFRVTEAGIELLKKYQWNQPRNMTDYEKKHFENGKVPHIGVSQTGGSYQASRRKGGKTDAGCHFERCGQVNGKARSQRSFGQRWDIASIHSDEYLRMQSPDKIETRKLNYPCANEITKGKLFKGVSFVRARNKYSAKYNKKGVKLKRTSRFKLEILAGLWQEEELHKKGLLPHNEPLYNFLMKRKKNENERPASHGILQTDKSKCGCDGLAEGTYSKQRKVKNVDLNATRCKNPFGASQHELGIPPKQNYTKNESDGSCHVFHSKEPFYASQHETGIPPKQNYTKNESDGSFNANHPQFSSGMGHGVSPKQNYTSFESDSPSTDVKMKEAVQRMKAEVNSSRSMVNHLHDFHKNLAFWKMGKGEMNKGKVSQRGKKLFKKKSYKLKLIHQQPYGKTLGLKRKRNGLEEGPQKKKRRVVEGENKRFR